MKDIDGAREINFLAQGGSVFVWGRGFDYEFDRGIFTNQIKKLLNLSDSEKAPSVTS
jgi:hypothetical protein